MMVHFIVAMGVIMRPSLCLLCQSVCLSFRQKLKKLLIRN